MEAIVVLWHFPLIVDYFQEYTSYSKILITDKSVSLDRGTLDSYYDEIIEADDIYDKGEMVWIMNSISSVYTVKAVYSAFESVVEMAGYLREAFKIPGMKEQDCIRVRDKYAMKRALQEKNIRTAYVSTVDDIQDLTAFIAEHGYPVIIKPRNGLATLHTYKLNSPEDLQAIHHLAFFSKASHSPATTGLDIERFTKSQYIVESFIDGEEYHCDSIVTNGCIIFSSVAKYLHNCIDTIDSSNPVGSIVYPKSMDQTEIVQKIKSVNTNSIQALNIRNAVCHLEVFVTAKGEVFFGEIAVRIGGGPLIGACIQNTYNVNIFQAFVEVELGDYQLKETREEDVFTGFITFPTGSGKIIDISDVAEYQERVGVKEVVISSKPGNILMGKKSTIDRTGYLIMESLNCDTLKAGLIQAYSEFRLVLDENAQVLEK